MARTLHKAIIDALKLVNKPSRIVDIIGLIGKYNLYQKKDGSEIESSQIYARAASHKDKFIIQNGLAALTNKGQVNEKKIARITWNTEGWITASGWDGKSRSASTHEGKYGFGHEEWLFDFSQKANGFKYGFIEGFHMDFEVHTGAIYDVQLFTIDSTNKISYWVGTIKNCSVLTDEERISIRKVFFQKRWYHNEVNRLKELGLWNEQVAKSFEKYFLPNVKFREADVEVFEDLIPIFDDSKMANRWRYKLFNWYDGAEESLKPAQFTFTATTPRSPQSKIRRKVQQPKSREVSDRHQEIAETLYEHLCMTYSKDQVGCDLPTGGGTYIDMVVQLPKNNYLVFEIKAYNDLRKSVREALGQILEYAYFTSKMRAKKLVILSDKSATIQIANYFKQLRGRFSIPIEYWCINLKSGTIEQTI